MDRGCDDYRREGARVHFEAVSTSEADAAREAFHHVRQHEALLASLIAIRIVAMQQ